MHRFPCQEEKEEKAIHQKMKYSKAQVAQQRLAQTENRLDAYYNNHVAAMEQMRQLTAKLAGLDLRIIRFTEIIKMLEEAFKLLGELQKNWRQLVLFFMPKFFCSSCYWFW